MTDSNADKQIYIKRVSGGFQGMNIPLWIIVCRCGYTFYDQTFADRQEALDKASQITKCERCGKEN